MTQRTAGAGQRQEGKNTVRIVTAWASRNAVGLILVVVAVYAVVESSGWRMETRLAPVACAVFFGLMAVIAIVRDTLASRRQAATAATAAQVADAPRAEAAVNPDIVGADGPVSDDAPANDAPAPGTVTKGVLWFGGSLVIVMLAGIQVGLPLAIALLCLVAVRARLVTTALLLVFNVGMIWMFGSFFRIRWFEPLLLRFFS